MGLGERGCFNPTDGRNAAPQGVIQGYRANPSPQFKLNSMRVVQDFVNCAVRAIPLRTTNLNLGAGRREHVLIQVLQDCFRQPYDRTPWLPHNQWNCLLCAWGIRACPCKGLQIGSPHTIEAPPFRGGNPERKRRIGTTCQLWQLHNDSTV